MTEVVAEALPWYLAYSILGWLGFPFVCRACRSLPDRGLSLSRPVGLLLVVVPVWWLGEMFGLSFNTAVLAVASGLVGLCGLVMELLRPQALLIVQREWRLVLVVEFLSAASFLMYVLFRGFQPAIVHTEKPMNLAFLASAIRSERLPVPDPWLSGFPANYYTLGYVVAASLAKLTNTPPQIAYSLQLATIFASAAVTAFGIGSNLAQMWQSSRARAPHALGGLAAVALLLFLGNLYTPWQLLRHPSATLEASWWQGIGWQASRVIVDTGFVFGRDSRQTINEFPAFSFVLGDLHPHLLALPLVLTALGIGASLFLMPWNRWAWMLGGIMLGSSYALNAWDMPTIGLLLFTALALSPVRGRPLWVASAVGCIGLLGIVTSLPFILRYVPSFGAPTESLPAPLGSLPLFGWLVRTLGLVVWSRSSFGELLLVHGLFLILGWLLLVQLANRLPVSLAAAAVATGCMLVVAWIAAFPALVFFALPAATLLWLAASGRLAAPARFTALIVGLCWGLVSAVEVVFLRDAFGDRMNTVFKVYFQVWALQSVVLGGALPTMIEELLSRNRLVGTGVAGTVGLLVLATSTYLPISAYHWTDGFSEWIGLDGLRYLERQATDEAAGISWLARHARHESVVLEAPGCSYGVTHGLPHNRVSMATGVPTVLGWLGHEYQWRRGDPTLLVEIDRRLHEVATLYEAADLESLRSTLERYQVEFVYIGLLERHGLGAACQTLRDPDPQHLEASLAHLGWTRSFSQGEVTIYTAPSLRW